VCDLGCNLENTGLINDFTFLNQNTENNITLFFNDTLSIVYHDTLRNPEESLWITFDSLLEDSRCPTDLMCWWEGNACLLFDVNKNNIEHRIFLNTYTGFTRDTTILKYRIFLIEVLPIPHSDSVYTPAEYMAKIYLKSQS